MIATVCLRKLLGLIFLTFLSDVSELPQAYLNLYPEEIALPSLLTIIIVVTQLHSFNLDSTGIRRHLLPSGAEKGRRFMTFHDVCTSSSNLHQYQGRRENDQLNKRFCPM